MINITETILNFQHLLIAVSKSLATIELFKGCDEWEELTEAAFEVLVVNHILETFDCSISHQYETWNINKNGIVVRVKGGVCLLRGVKEKPPEQGYRYIDIPKSTSTTNFYFVEFGNPSFNEEDIAGLDYVSGLDANGDTICVNKKYCEFFVTN